MIKKKIPLERYTVISSYHQSSMYTGDIWYIWDNVLEERRGRSYGSSWGLQEQIEELNTKWQNEIEQTQWQRDAKYFSHLHCSYSHFHDFPKAHTLDGPPLPIQELNKFQERRSRIICDLICDITSHNTRIKDRIADYNGILKKENAIRRNFDLPVMQPILTTENFNHASEENMKWAAHFLNSSSYWSVFQ